MAGEAGSGKRSALLGTPSFEKSAKELPANTHKDSFNY